MTIEAPRNETSFQSYFQEHASQEVARIKENLLETCSGYLPEETLSVDISKIGDAYDTAFFFHDTNPKISKRYRGTGEQYMVHPGIVAQMVADLRLDAFTIQAALLHDTLEDTEIKEEYIVQNFGQEVLDAVKTETKVTTLSGGKTGSKETLAKLYEAFQGDARGVILKLPDRLHNMRTITGLPRIKQFEKAKETLQVYVPLANRMGMTEVADELKDLSYRVLNPALMVRADQYAQSYRNFIKELECSGFVEDFKKTVTHPDDFFVRILPPKAISFLPEPEYDGVLDASDRHKIQLEAVYGNEIDFELMVKRLMSLKVLPDDADYKGNTINLNVDYGEIKIECNLHTREGWLEANKSILALYQVKDPRDEDFEVKRKHAQELQNTLKLILSQLKSGEIVEPTLPKTWVRQAREALRIPHLTVITPREDKIMLPVGSTALDFAYRLHTNIGRRAVNATINGDDFNRKEIGYKLQDGDHAVIHRDESRWTVDPSDLDTVTNPHYKNIIRRSIRRIITSSNESGAKSDDAVLSAEWRTIIGGDTVGDLRKRAEELRKKALERGKVKLKDYYVKNYHRLYRNIQHKDYTGRTKSKPIADLDKAWDRIPQELRKKYSEVNNFLINCGLDSLSKATKEEYIKALILYETELPTVRAQFPDRPRVLAVLSGIIASSGSNILDVEQKANEEGLLPGYSQVEFTYDPSRQEIKEEVLETIRRYTELLDRKQKEEKIIFPGTRVSESDGIYVHHAKLSQVGYYFSVLESLGFTIISTSFDKTTGEHTTFYRQTDENIPPEIDAEEIKVLLELVTVLSERHD